MLLLAFDTATPAITVAVHDGTAIVGEASGHGAMAHGELLAPAIRDAMQQAGAAMADLTDVAVGVGPGPFTGLRVGVVTALTLGSTLGLVQHGVCSLDIVAADVLRYAGSQDPDGISDVLSSLGVGAQEPVSKEFLVATDARRKEVYWARYSADGARLDGPHVSFPADLARQHPDLLTYGRGGELYDGVLRPAGEAQDPRAAALASAVIAGRVTELPLEPLYLRRPDAVPQIVNNRA